MVNPFTKRNSVLGEVQAAFAPLINGGRLCVADESDEPQAFGNGVVVLEGSVVRVRVVKDRGTFEVEVGSREEPGKWYFLERALRGCTGDQELADTPLALQEAASTLEQHFTVLEHHFDAERWPATRSACEAIDDAARQEWVERFKQNEPTK